MDSSQVGALDASSVPAGRPRIDSGASAASGTDQGNDEDPPAVLSGRAAYELSSWGRLPATVRNRIWGQSQRLEGEPAQRELSMRPEVADALLAAAYEWTKSGSMLKRTSWTTEDAMAMNGWRTCCRRKQRGVERAYAEWFPGRRRTAPVVRSRCRAFAVQSGVARGHEK